MRPALASALRAAGVEAQLGPLAAAYVLFLAIAGPLVTRSIEPIIERVRAAGAPGPEPAT